MREKKGKNVCCILLLPFLKLYCTKLTPLMKKPFKNIVGKGKNVLTRIFSFSHNVFYHIKDKLLSFENYGKYMYWLKKCNENMDRWTCLCNITEIMFKMALL